MRATPQGRRSFRVAQSRLFVLVDELDPFEEVVASLNHAVDATSRAAVVGLGRFGRVLARRLQQEGALTTVVERDLHACLSAAEIDPATVDGVADNAVSWAQQLGTDSELDAVFVCLDDDVANLQVGHDVAKQLHGRPAVVVLRAVHPALQEVHPEHVCIEHTTTLISRWFQTEFLG